MVGYYNYWFFIFRRGVLAISKKFGARLYAELGLQHMFIGQKNCLLGIFNYQSQYSP